MPRHDEKRLPPTIEVVQDLLDFHSEPATVCRPHTLAELVAAVVSTEPGHNIRAVGSVWAPSDVNRADCVIRTEHLDQFLTQPWLAPKQLDDMRVRQPALASSVLASISRDLQLVEDDDPNRGPNSHPLVWVEAGIKVRQLLADLESCGLCLPTMGAGAGQSLAGILSTATHGGDFAVNPLPSWVRAVHLVAAGGQEWFVTDSGSSLSIDALAEDPNWCPDARLVKDSDLLNALRVSVGRFGVIYSVVLEVVPQYGMLEVTSKEDWKSLHALLAASPSADTGVFLQPVTTATAGWLSETLIAPLDRQISAYEQDKAAAEHAEPPEPYVVSPWETEVRQRRGSFLQIDQLTDDSGNKVLSQGAHPLTHLNIVIALGRNEPTSWVQRRWRIPVPAEEQQILPATRHGEISQAVIDAGASGSAMIPTLQKQFDPAAKDHDANDVINLSVYKDLAGSAILTSFRDLVIPMCCVPAKTGADALMFTLYTALNTQWEVAGHDLTQRVVKPLRDSIDGAIATGLGIQLSGACAEQQWVPLVRAGWATRMLDTHDYDLDYLQSGHTCEFHFDAFGTDYLAFLDDVVTAAAGVKGALGLIGLRYTPRGLATLGMQKWDLTASVEVQLGRIRHDDVMAPLCEHVRALGHARGGIPHWGQECESEGVLADGFAEIDTWKRHLRAITGDGEDRFSTAFSRRASLEPSEVTAHLSSVVASTDHAATTSLLML